MSAARAGGARRTAGFRPALAALLVAALALRATGAGWGLPHTYHPDEHQYVDSAVAMLGGDLDPGRFTNPTGLKYLYAALFAAVAATGRLLGDWPNAAAFQAAFAADPSAAYAMARLVTALLGTATVALAYRLGRRLSGPAAGIAAAALLAAAFLHARDAHFAVNDVLVALLATAVLEQGVRLTRGAGPGALHRGALLVGMASATKYSAAATALPLALGYALGALAGRDGSDRAVGARRGPAHGAGTDTATGSLGRVLRRALDGRLAVAGAIAAAAFLAVVPYSLLRPEPFLADVAQLAERGREGFKGVAIDDSPGWIFYLESLAWGLGPALLAAAVAGIGRALARRDPAGWVVASLPLALWGYLGGQLLMFARFMIPALPALCVLAGALAAAAGGWLAARSGGRPGAGGAGPHRRAGERRIDGPRAAAATAAIVGALAAPTLADAIRFDVLIRREDTRTLAKRWIEANVPEGSAVLSQSNGPELAGLADDSAPPGTTRRFALTELDTLELPERSPEDWRDDGHEFLVVSSFSSDRRLLDPAKDAAHRAYYAALESEWPVRAEFAPYRGDRKPPFAFAQLYGPATSMYRFVRPGPLIRVYDLDPD